MTEKRIGHSPLFPARLRAAAPYAKKHSLPRPSCTSSAAVQRVLASALVGVRCRIHLEPWRCWTVGGTLPDVQLVGRPIGWKGAAVVQTRAQPASADVLGLRLSEPVASRG